MPKTLVTTTERKYLVLITADTKQEENDPYPIPCVCMNAEDFATPMTIEEAERFQKEMQIICPSATYAIVELKPVTHISKLGSEKYYGLYITDRKALDTFWQFHFPCGNSAIYPINGLPEYNVPCPCGNPNHWFVKLADEVAPTVELKPISV